MRATPPPVVLIHGVGLDHTMWLPVMAALPHRRLIAYDMIGHGSAPVAPGPYGLATFVDQLSGIVTALGCEIDLVGFSMGALVAQGFALRPESRRLRRLVLLNGVYDRSPTETQAVVERVAEVRRSGVAGTVEPALQRWFTPEFASAHPEIVDGVRQRLQANDPRAYADAYEVFATADRQLCPGAAQIPVPTLVATGADDRRSTPAMAARMARMIPGGRSVSLPRLRHLTPLEAPSVVATLIDDFCS